MPGPNGQLGCVWEGGSMAATTHPALEGAHLTETVIIGAGIVGLSTALRLAEQGRPVIVLEGLRVGRQVSGRSSAKITTQHRLIYRHLLASVGVERAAAYAEANTSAPGRSADGSTATAYPATCRRSRLMPIPANGCGFPISKRR